MYLQRIELHGFKSFANRTVLEFPESKKNTKGITAIVGPNGSGKSNVVDAVRWVLGEQSLKLLRGKKSTDIIFAGSAKKAQLSLAEVSLHLNNEDRVLDIDYPEIEITRRIYRDGASDYLLNKKPVRLFDIVMLLAKANFGQNTYSVIGQGMVDKIVNYSGQERKEFFDEATGVKQFQIKREKSVNKLKRSRENILQAQTLIKELDPHLKSLTRQVERLHKRQIIEEELRDLQIKYYGKQWLELDISHQELIIAFTGKEKQKIRFEREIEALQEKLDSFSQESGRSEDFNKLQQEYNLLIQQKNDLLKDLIVIKGKMDLEFTKLGKQNITWLQDRIEEINKRIEEIKENKRGENLKAQSRKQELILSEKELHELNDELTVLQNNLQILQDEFYRAKSGSTTNNYAFESVKGVLAQKNYISGIYGTVSELGKIDKKYELALATAAGNRLWAVVVESDEVAVKCIKYLKENRLSSVTFFPLNKLSHYQINNDAYDLARYDGAINLAVELVACEDKFANVFRHVFGSTLVVNNSDSARNIGIGRERMVTLEGDIFEKSGIIKGGYKAKESAKWLELGANKAMNQQEKLKEIMDLKTKINEKYLVKEKLSNKIGEIRVDLRFAEANDKGSLEEVNLLQKEKNKITAELDQQMSPKDQDQYLRELNQQKTEKDSLLQQIEIAVATMRQKVDDFNLKEEQKKREIFAIQQSMHQKQLDLNGLVTSLNEIKIQLTKIETKKEDLLLSVKTDLGEEYKLKVDRNFELEKIEELVEKIHRLKKQLELIGGTDPEVEKEYNEVKSRFDFLTKESDDLTQAIADLEKVVVELDKLIKNQFEEEFKKINQDFSRYFKKLFDGGSAKLILMQKEQTEAEIARDEVNNTIAGEKEGEEGIEIKKEELHIEDKSFLANMGIEIEACPPGKKIKNIAVLSGGEKTMTALALICAIIANNPSPFILFDEVDAALDENNSAKFSGIIEELAHKTQFIVITHNRAIMSRADVLYGVTMQGDGISRLIGLKLEEAQQLTK